MYMNDLNYFHFFSYPFVFAVFDKRKVLPARTFVLS